MKRTIMIVIMLAALPAISGCGFFAGPDCEKLKRDRDNAYDRYISSQTHADDKRWRKLNKEYYDECL